MANVRTRSLEVLLMRMAKSSDCELIAQWDGALIAEMRAIIRLALDAIDAGYEVESKPGGE